MNLLALSRIAVMASAVLLVAAGLWPLVGLPQVMVSLGALFAGAAWLARTRPAVATPIVFLFAYAHYGVARLVFGAELASMPFWLAAFTGLALGGASWTRWEASEGWRVPLAWWATSVALTWPFFAARDLGYSAAPSMAAGPIVMTAALQMALALWMDRHLAPDERSGGTSMADGWWARALAASALATGSMAIYQWLVDPSVLSGEPWVSLHRSVGMMGDANPTGVAAGVWAPLVWTLAPAGPVGLAAGGAAAVLLWLAAWVTGARTTIILMAAGLCGLAMVVGRARGLSRRVMLGGAAVAGVAVGIAAVLAVSAVTRESPLGRLVTAMPRSSPGAAAYELLWRRDGYGLAAVEAIREHPLVGVGVGRFVRESTGYYQRLSGQPIPPDNAQNFWRHTLAEQGVFGLVPIVWLTLLALRGVVSRAGTLTALMMRVMLAGLGVALVFGYPVQDAGIAVTMGALVVAVERDRRATRARAA
ncbi:MAG: O-antigen ligase family protein [Vicinamibacterales bacterium]